MQRKAPNQYRIGEVLWGWLWAAALAARKLFRASPTIVQESPMSVSPVEDEIRHLYRFRSIERLLDHGELQRQEIYFAKPEELNDPMEGFRDIFWRGDEIVWKNLLRHYLMCLERAFCLLAILGEEHRIGWDQIPILNFGDTSLTVQQKAKHDEIISTFFANPGIRDCIKSLSNRALPIRRNELNFYLRIMHMYAIYTINQCYERHKFIPSLQLNAEITEKLANSSGQLAKVIAHVGKLYKRPSVNEFNVDAFFEAQQRTLAELDLINLYNGTVDPRLNNRNFVFFNFCDEYVIKLENLVYPDWYTACFMRECVNSSVWGSYGINHTAVCLKFKVKSSNGRSVIPLNRMNAVGSGGPGFGIVNTEFFEVKYDNDHLPVDFFRSLGRLPIPTLRQYWYADSDGRKSACGDDIFNAEAEWRARYWSAFQHAIVRKLKDWSYEREYRLMLSGLVLDFSDKNSRTVTYDFNDLDGIIFGIKTPNQKKLEIFKIVEEKCRAAKRSDFRFYQAFYSRKSAAIEHAEMAFLRFQI
jgi:hypothetical protein